MVARSSSRALLLCGYALLAGCGEDHTSPTEQGEEQTEDTLDGGVAVLDAATGTAPPLVTSDAGRARDAERPSADAAEAPVDSGAEDADDASTPPAASSACDKPVGAVPSALRQRLKLDGFYKKYLDADGIPVLASDKPDDASLKRACELVSGLLAKRADVTAALIERQARFVIIGKNEGTADVPEYGYGPRPQADKDQINQRARGLGGQVASCGEENMLCLPGDRYRDESICLHEFAHTISTYGVYEADGTFERRLKQAYDSASKSGILDKTYRKESVQEYWAEGVQDYYDTNASAMPSNGIHNQVDTRPELKTFDPTLYGLVEEVFPPALSWMDCHAK